MMRLLADQLESGALIDAARGREDTLRPQGHRRIAGLLGEAQALVDPPLAKPEPARLRSDDEEAQRGERVGLAHHERRADRRAVELGDPTALARRIEFLDELGGDLGD